MAQCNHTRRFHEPERAEALARVERLLARYPGEPHVARVKWLVR